MPAAELEAHDEARFARAVAHAEVFRIKLTYPQREASGDPGLIERAWGVELPESFCEFVRRLDGGAIQGEGGVLAIWKTRENLALHHEDYRAFKSTPGARVVFFASDYGSREYFFDVDDYYGHGAYAVLLADVARGHGIAARLASGYLCEFEGGAKVAEGALHAWTELYLPGAGWIGFDPTNGYLCNHYHLTAAVGLTPDDISPIAGTFAPPLPHPPIMTASLHINPA